jgi:hypothetical protein
MTTAIGIRWARSLGTRRPVRSAASRSGVGLGLGDAVGLGDGLGRGEGVAVGLGVGDGVGLASAAVEPPPGEDATTTAVMSPAVRAIPIAATTVAVRLFTWGWSLLAARRGRSS